MTQEIQPDNRSEEEKKAAENFEVGKETQEAGQKQSEEEKTASPENIEKAKQEIQTLVDEAIRIKSQAEKLDENVRGVISALERVKSDLDRRDLTTKAIEPLLEQTLPWFQGQLLQLEEKTTEFSTRESNLQIELKENPGDSQSILTRAKATKEEAIAEINRIASAMENYATDSAGQARGIMRRTENYLGEPVDRDSNVYRTAATMQRMQNEISEAKTLING